MHPLRYNSPVMITCAKLHTGWGCEMGQEKAEMGQKKEGWKKAKWGEETEQEKAWNMQTVWL